MPSSRLELWSLGEARTLELGADYLLRSAGSQTLIPRRVPVIFVGHGIVAPEFDYNDYQDLDVRGKVVVYLAGEPRSDDPDFFNGDEPSVYAAPETKSRIALSRGAVGSLLVPLAPAGLEAAWERSRREYAFEQLSLAYALPGHLSAILHPDVGRGLFADALYGFDQVLAMERTGGLRSFPLPVELSFEGRFRSRDVLSSNVVGALNGFVPVLKETYVVVVAHYDHLGVGPEVAGDSVYNGVVDNALGVACVLEVAAALARMDRPPRRSVIVLLTTAEESGLLGASYFLDHSPVGLDRISAAVNVDGLAFLDRFSDVFGIGGELSDLGERLRRAVRPLGLEVSPPPSEVWDHAAYSRGDQVAFARAGVPAILVNEGFQWDTVSAEEALEIALEWMATRYHSPQDDLSQPIDYEAAALHCEAVLRLVLQVANDPADPQWLPGVPYAYQRLLSLADAR
jgi:Zn-dependent M28 family amino/carboxypeptidase